MQVSAVLANSFSSVFNTRASHRNFDGYVDFSNTYLNSLTKQQEEKRNVYDSINEWKNFCHSQIAKGHLDVIA